MEDAMGNIVLFGGSGFVGTHLTQFLVRLNQFNTIYLADLTEPSIIDEKVRFIRTDVRTTIPSGLFEGSIDAIVNLAAIHRTPGHPSRDYFETNILGARNVGAFAEEKNAGTVFFTSSISVYGPGEDEKTEDSVPMPEIPYGSSKAIAESIHREWFLKAPSQRKLTIVRPAVIFGKGEKGNFTRIGNALQKRLFPYPGRKDTIKGCLYVKDLCRFICDSLAGPPGYSLFNFCYPQKYTLENICNAFNKALGFRMPFITIPLPIMKSAAVFARSFNLPVTRSMGFHPDRVMKLVRSTNISSSRLTESGFQFKYNLVDAIRDWAQDCGTNTLY